MKKSNLAVADQKRASRASLGRKVTNHRRLASHLALTSLVALGCAADLQGGGDPYNCSLEGSMCGTGTTGGMTGTTGGSGGTGGGSGDPIPPEPSCLAPLFAKSCNACHSTQSAPILGAHLALDTPNLGATLVTKKATYEQVTAADMPKCKPNALIIDPVTPSESVLLKKVTVPDCGFVMPFGAPVLQGADLACIQDWVMKF